MMPGLQDYIAEESQRASGPVVGDDFAIVLEEDCLLETHVIDVIEDGYVLAADATLIAMLESHGVQLEDHAITTQSTDSDSAAVTESRWNNTQAELALILDRAGITESEYADDHIRGFYVVITDEDSGPFVGMVVRDGGRWRERGGRGSRPNNWGATYMSYLAPEDVMQWIRQDYGRGAEVKGPFYDEDKAYQYADMMSEAAAEPHATVKYGEYGEWQQAARQAGATQFHTFGDDGELIINDPEGEWSGSDASYEEADVVKKGSPAQTVGRWDWDNMTGYIQPPRVSEAEYQGRKVTLNKPMPNTDGKSKSKVYVKDPQTGNVKKVTFGDPDMKIKKSNPERRKSFRARHNCDNPGPKTKARFWSCKAW